MKFRKAQPLEIQELNSLIRESKAFWGYSHEFIQKFMDKFGLSIEHLNKLQIAVMIEQEVMVAVIAFDLKESEPILDYFFLAPRLIGKGFGRKMWHYAVKVAKENNWDTFTFYSDPHSEGFYRHMGAEKIGEFESFPGRFVPVMRYKLTT